MQDNIFEWHFAVRGPQDTEFQVLVHSCLTEKCCTEQKHYVKGLYARPHAYRLRALPLSLASARSQRRQIRDRNHLQGGIYHGRILLPPEYPFKPPSFLMLTPNGRFETSAKICLSISSHHPEHWQPSWSVRTALTALIAFFPTPGNGAIGSLVCSHLTPRVQPQYMGPCFQYVYL